MNVKHHVYLPTYLLTSSRCPRPDWTCFCYILEVGDGNALPSVPRSAGGVHNGSNVSVHQVMAEGPIQVSRWKGPTVFHLFFCNLWVFFDQARHFDHVVRSQRSQEATTVTIFKHDWTCELKSCVPVVNCKSGWRLVPKIVWQTLEALLERLLLPIIVINHCTKLYPWKCFCGVGRAVTLS